MGDSTKLYLVTGEPLEVEGSIEDVKTTLQDAARSTQGTLAWLTELGAAEPVGVNPSHVVLVRSGARS